MALSAEEAHALYQNALDGADHPPTGAEGEGQHPTCTEAGCVPVGCGCFPGTTGVATPHGLVPIVSLKVGDLVLAEDPTSHVVEPDAVQAVIDDGIKPLMAVGLSDGSSLKVTTNHPFYVDSGPGLGHAQWVQAGDLRVGERLRTEDGKDVAVVALRDHMGDAHVYTLTVAHDHTFFVGTARILVHNANCSIKVDNPNASEILSKGVHVKISGVTKGSPVELNVGLNKDGDVVFSPTFSAYTDQQVKVATQAAQAGLQDPKIVDDLIASAEHAEALARTSSNARAGP